MAAAFCLLLVSILRLVGVVEIGELYNTYTRQGEFYFVFFLLLCKVKVYYFISF